MTNSKILVPPIKCQGIKTKLVPWVKAIAPPLSGGRWVEPFSGSGVVAFNIGPKRALLCDSNPHLINFYKALQKKTITAAIAKNFLEQEGAKLLESEGAYFYSVRERFNQSADPLDFLFLNRSCFNGMIRFNRKGGFNVPFCRKPSRFAQAYVTKITNQIRSISQIISEGDYEFINQDFSETISCAAHGDVIYADPPYIDRHTDYFNGWGEAQEMQLAKYLDETKANFILSTWHSNKYRSNGFIDSIWSQYHIYTREHFYHVGGKEENRNPMLEAIVTNFKPDSSSPQKVTMEQSDLFEVE